MSSQCDGSHVSLHILTDEHPNEITWTLKEINSNKLFTGGPYTDKNENYHFEGCFNAGSYKFKINFSSEHDMSVASSYSLRLDNEIIKASGDDSKFATNEEHSFVIKVTPRSLKEDYKNEHLLGLERGEEVSELLV